VGAVAGHGLDSDCHASPLSPRQVLIASYLSYQALGLPPTALRENILVDFAINDIVSGSRLRFGSGVEMVAMFRCEPCGRLDRHQDGLQSRIGAERGLLARVIESGVIQAEDGVRVTRWLGSPLWSDDWRERVLQVLKAVPNDRWITYTRLAKLAGVSAGYCRAFPRLLACSQFALEERAGPANWTAHRGEPWNADHMHDMLVSDRLLDRPEET
jgi:hypothetical protein